MRGAGVTGWKNLNAQQAGAERQRQSESELAQESLESDQAPIFERL